jgi:hypothetical protein
VTQRTRAGIALAVVAVLAVGLGVYAAVVRHNARTAVLHPSSVPGITQTPAPGACVDATAARGIWTDVSKRVDALVLHPDLSRIGDVADGTAAEELRVYIQTNLLDHKLTEREQERLDDVRVLQPGCHGAPLTLQVRETLVHDDYLAPDGHVDHVDAGVGSTHTLVDTYFRTGDTWRITAIEPADQSTPAPSGGQSI